MTEPLTPKTLMGRRDLSEPDLLFDFSHGEADSLAVCRAIATYGVAAILVGEDFSDVDQAFARFYNTHAQDREVDRFNGVNFALEHQLPPELVRIEAQPTILDVVTRYIVSDPAYAWAGETEATTKNSVGILNSKLLVKDAAYSDEVFLHQDACYQLGRTKITGFFLLSDLRSQNLRQSTIRALLGTHKLGHLGDAGRIDRAVLAPDWPEFEFALNKRTFVLMDPNLWHYSPAARLQDEVRAIYTFTYVAGAPLCRRTPGELDERGNERFHSGDLFVRSRSSRLRELQAMVDAIEK